MMVVDDQNVGLVMHELEHHLFQFAFRHLSVAHDDARPRHQFLQLGGNLPDAVHAVVHEIDLAAAFQFLLDGRLDQLFVPAGDHGLYRNAVLRRSLDHAHVAQSDQRHVQGARNRRGRHGQHVHLLAHLLQPLFVAHAETLFFVHHQQAQVGKLHVFREQAMGADQDVDFARFHLLQNFFLLLRRAEAADHLDGDGKRRKALLESFVVLEGEDGGGREHRNLLVVADGLERGAHGDFRLAVAHVAAQQAVHGLGRFHVALDVGDGGLLVFGLAEFEGVFELAHPFVVGGEGMALGGLALGVELEQLVGHVLHGLAHARFGLGPGRRAQMIQYAAWRLPTSGTSAPGRDASAEHKAARPRRIPAA